MDSSKKPDDRGHEWVDLGDETSADINGYLDAEKEHIEQKKKKKKRRKKSNTKTLDVGVVSHKKLAQSCLKHLPEERPDYKKKWECVLWGIASGP